MRTRLTILLSIIVAASPATAQWEPDGNALSGGGVPQIVTDGSGGAIVAWEYWDPWGSQWDFAMGQRLSPGGNEVWQPGGHIVASSNQNLPQLVSDGAGGAIFVWLDNRNGFVNIYAQRIDASGAEQWAPGGVAIRVGGSSVDYANLAVVSDGSGGAIIAWADPRVDGMDIYARRIDAAGTALWTVNGNPVCIAAGTQVEPVAVADGSGGAWIAWVDVRNGNGDIYARHVAANGFADGVADGFALCTATGIQWRAQIAPDESGGAIVAWQDERTGIAPDIYAQRVSSAGAVEWTTNGIAVCSEASYQETPTIASGGSGGAVVVWRDSRTQPAGGIAFYAQRVNGAGVPQWTADGDLLGTSMSSPFGFREHAVIADGSGESIVTWAEDNYDEVTFQPVTIIRVQRLGTDGSAQWTAGGVELIYNDDLSNSGVRVPALVSDGWGGAIVVWEDWRYWQASAVYAAHVSPSGAVTDVGPARGPSMVVANVYPNPFSGAASIAIQLEKPGKVDIDIFDVAGRKVRSLVQSEAALSHVVELRDRDDAGNLLPSGVYFCRVRSASETVTRKMVITR